MSKEIFAQQVVFLYCADLARSAAFYGDTLGLDMVLDQGGCRIYRVAGNAFLGVCGKGKTEVGMTEGVIVTLVSEDVDGWYRRLADKGVEFEKPPERNEAFDIYHCFLRDPDGYLLEIQRFEDPRWPAPDIG